MHITLNTYGIRSVNSASFNRNGNKDEYMPRSMRDLVVTLLKINNLVLNILGYIPGIKQISGGVRMGIGSCIVILTLAVGSPNSKEGLIVGRWYDEALTTGIAQIERGAVEAFVPFSSSINGILDIIGTVINISIECSHNPSIVYTVEDEMGRITYKSKPPKIEAGTPCPDPDYPLPLALLYLA